MPEESTPAPRQPPPGATVATLPRAPGAGGPPGQQQLPAPPLHGPWPAVSVWGRRWPGPGRLAPTATIGAVGGAAVVAASSLPLDRAGLGWLVAAFGGVIALAVAGRLSGPAPAFGPAPARPGRQPERLARRRLGAQRYFWSAATVALLGVGTVRAAGWLFLLCLVTAVWTAALAVSGGRSLRGMLVSLQMALVAPIRALPWIVRGAGSIRRRRTGGPAGVRVVATIAISGLLLLVFGGLFASADAAFAEVLSRALPDLNVGTAVRWVFVFVFVVAGLILAGAAYLRAAPPDLSGLDGRGTRRVARFEWAVPLGLLVALFAAFVGVQLTVLFGDSSHVLTTAGLTYADYARSGFWQLAVVTVLTLVVLAGAARWAPRETGGDRVLIRVLLGSLAALTLVIVASSLHRMNLYSDTYGLTRLRVLVAACELWLGAVFVLLLIAGIRLRGDWVPRVAIGLGVLALLGLAAANPDGLIADRNITRYQQLNRLDTAYLAGLSADAVPALERLRQAQRDCVLRAVGDFRDDPDDWRGWNYGRQHAQDLLAAHPIDETGSCDYFSR